MNRPIITAKTRNTPSAVVSDLQSAFSDFKTDHDARVDQLTDAVDDVNSRLVALQVGGGAFDPVNDTVGRKAFASFLRHGQPQAGMRESSDPDGGYAVPKTIDAVIQNQLLDFSPIRNWATVITLGQGAGTYSFLINKRGASSGWVGELEARPETDTPAFGAITPPSGEVYANASLSQWLLDDSSFDMDQFIRDNVIDEFAVQEGVAFVSGDGVNKPRGLLTYDTASTGDDTRAFGTLQYVPTAVAADINDSTHNGIDALVDLVYSVKPAYRAGPGVGWLMNSTVASKVRKLKSLGDTAGYLWQEPVQAGQPAMLLGYPVAIDENMSDVGANAFPIAFGNWRRGYRIVDRLGTRILRDPYTNKPNVMFYLTKRVAGSLADSRAIKLLKCAAS